MSSYRVISSDSHVMEPPDLWTSWIEPRFRERAPRLVRDAAGDSWYFEGRKLVGLSGAIQTGTRYEDQEKLRSQVDPIIRTAVRLK